MIRFLLGCLCCIVCVQCAMDPHVGYSSSSLYSKNFRTIAVPIFDNTTMTRDMEFMLTDAVIKEIQVRTPYLIVDEQHADTIITGTITSIAFHTLSQSRTTGLDNEVMIEVLIDFEWINLQNGGRIVGRRNFASSALFIPSQPSAEPYEMGLFAVVQQLGSDIVDQMQAAW